MELAYGGRYGYRRHRQLLWLLAASPCPEESCVPELGPAVEYEARSLRRSLLALRASGSTDILPTENRSVLSYRRAHPRSAPFLSLTNFSDDPQSADAGIMAGAGLYRPFHVHSSAGQLDIRNGRIELPPWGFVWLSGT
jgi:hypothetical protein